MMAVRDEDDPAALLARWRNDPPATVRDECADLQVRRPDDPILATITERVDRLNDALLAAGLALLEAAFHDPTHARAVAGICRDAETLGVVSHGPRTLGVVEQLEPGEPPILITDRSSVARVLEGMGALVNRGDPASADRLLIPALAVHRHRIWSSGPILALAARALAVDPTGVVVHAHPFAHLSDATRTRFRPPGWCTDHADDRWTIPTAGV